VIQALIDIDDYHSGKLTEQTRPGENRDEAITRLRIKRTKGGSLSMLVHQEFLERLGFDPYTEHSAGANA
jgi:hypothetical protein